jgi:hypothetical protein
MTISKTQARVEGINQQIVRCDIRIPVAIYSKLEALAVSEGSKAHHITGRPMVSPIILEVLEVGLRHYKSEKSSEGDSNGLVPDTIQGNQYDIAALLDRITQLETQNQQPPTLDPDTKAELLDQLRGELQNLADTIAEKK